MPIEEFISGAIGFLLTVMIFSYLIKDNPLFRIALYIFIGVASGYAATAVWHYILVPKLVQPFMALDPLVIFPLILSFLVVTKLFPRVFIGNFALAVLVGVGAAATIGGALIGTVIPQFGAAIEGFSAISEGLEQFASGLFEGGIMLVGTITTLAAFHFSAGRTADGTPKRHPILEGVAFLGRIFIAITLGALFAGVYMAALTAMIERLNFIIIDFPSIIQQFLTGS